MQKITEALIDYVWQYQLFDFHQLQTQEGEKVEVVSPGIKNRHDGPDYFNARIKIGQTLWAGNVELHVKSSDWYLHKHQHDPNYQNVILHVVYQHDREVKDRWGEHIPCVDLQHRIPLQIYRNQLQLLEYEADWIPCEKLLHQVDDFTFKHWLDRLAIERLELKTKALLKELERNKGDWEQLSYACLLQAFGTKVNKEAFWDLAEAAPIVDLHKYRNNLFQLEAILLGQASLLHKPKDDYGHRLQAEHQYFWKKFGMEEIYNKCRFLRLRPPNFPTVRLAQFAALIHQSQRSIFSTIKELKHVNDWELLNKVQVSDYWHNHFTLNKSSTECQKPLTPAFQQHLFINAVIPLLFAYGHYIDQPSYKEQALNLLTQIPAEQNSIIMGWNKLSKKACHALDSQAMLHLKNEYCQHKQCLNCAIGNKIVRRESNS